MSSQSFLQIGTGATIVLCMIFLTIRLVVHADAPKVSERALMRFAPSRSSHAQKGTSPHRINMISF